MDYPTNTPKQSFYRFSLFLISLLPLPVLAIDYTWTGAVDDNWSDGGNWSGGSGTDFPDDASDLAIFNSAGTTFGKSVSLNDSYTVNVDFQSAGWTLTGNPSSGELVFQNESTGALATPLKSSGAGINTIEIGIHNDRGNDWDIGSGNTVVHTGKINFDIGTTKVGDGTLIMNSSSVVNGSGNVSTQGGTTLINYAQGLAGNTRPTIENGATLGGSGTIQVGNGSQNLQLRVAYTDNGGIVNPGGDGSTEGGSIIGTLSVDFTSTGTSNVVAFSDTSTFHVDVDPTSNTNDLLAITRGGSASVGGYMTIDGTDSTLDISTIGLSPFDPGDLFTIATFENASDYGEFTSVLMNGVDAFLNPDFYINYNLNDITVGLVPEPSVYASLGGLAVLGFACLRRRKA